MPDFLSLDPCVLLLAALPEPSSYVSILKLVVLLIAVILWAHNTAWVQQDTKKVRAPQTPWIAAVFGSGALCLVLWILIPVFWAGFGIFAVLYGAAIISYVVMRNKRVAPAETVLTMAHLERMGKGKKIMSVEDKHAKDRARIRTHEGKRYRWPDDPQEHAGYAAVQDLLFDAIWRRTTDVLMDFVPQQPVRVIYKIDGVERARDPLDAELAPALLMHFKTIAGMDPEEHRRPQTGHFETVIGAGGDAETTVEIVAKTSGSTAGERVLLSLISDEAKFRLPDLGLATDQLATMETIVGMNKGVVICSAPPSHGLTSTMYAILRSHDAFMSNIHTLELSPSMDLENITQHTFDPGDGSVTYSKRFRSLLRTEPDVCMASNTPDSETSLLAADAGRQGKKLYLGMTAKDTFSALRRYMAGVANPALVASSLDAILCQRLVRVLCTECRVGYKPDPKLLKKGNLPQDGERPFYRPPNQDEIEVDKRGNQLLCPVCQGSGYYGRTAVYEILLITDPLRALISKGTSLAILKAEARKQGFLYLQEVALKKVYDGITSINEVLRVTKDSTSKQ